jgi:dTDP-D-glucose 4,6-dehydratase
MENNGGSINICNIICHEFINFDVHRPGQDIRYSLDDSKLRSLGWSPKCVFDDEIPQIVKYYTDNFIW